MKWFLHQDFSNKELQAWMKNMLWQPTWQQFCPRDFSGGQVYWTRNLASGELQLVAIDLIVFPSRASYQPSPQFKAGLHHAPWSRTMEDGLFPWSNFLENQFTKPLGPSLGADRMWTKRNGHAPKNECVLSYLNISPNGSFEKAKVRPFPCLLLSSSPPIFFIKKIF